MIELREVTKEYSKGIAALNGVNIKIEQGELVRVLRISGVKVIVERVKED